MDTRKSDAIYEILLQKGFAESLCREIAYKYMNTDYTATRMLGYLYRMTELKEEQLVDEMIAILEDRDRIIKKHEMEQAQAAINRRSGKETHRRIDVIHAQFAGTRTHIRNAGLHGHTIAHFEAFDARTDLNHRAGSLMTENHRLLHHIFAHATMSIIVQVGTAHTNGMRRDLQLA